MTPRAYDAEDRVFVGPNRRLFCIPEGMTLGDQTAIAERLLDWSRDRRAEREGWIDTADMDALLRRGVTVVRARSKWPSTASNARWNGRIAMGALAGPALVCHEFAHVLAPRNGHGAKWRAAYLACVAEVLGGAIAASLRDEFDQDFLPGRDRARPRSRAA